MVVPMSWKRTLTRVRKELEKIGQAIRIENQEKLTQVGIELSQFDPDQVGILLDAAGRFRLKNADLALLGGYPKASVTQLALATELLQMGLSHEKVEFSLVASFPLKSCDKLPTTFYTKNSAEKMRSILKKIKAISQI